MFIRKTSLSFVSSSLLLILFASVAITNAQQALPQNSLTIERIADERDRQSFLPRNFKWEPSGKTLGFIRTLPIANGASRNSNNSEILGIDATTGQRRLLVSASQLTAAFGFRPPRLPGEDEEGPSQGQFRDFDWAAGGHALLLSSGQSLVWFDLDTHSSRFLVNIKRGLSDPKISPDGRNVSFVHDHALWLASIATGVSHPISGTRKKDVYQGEPDWLYLRQLKMRSAYWWSPDSSSIAWMETNDHDVERYSLRKSDGSEEVIASPGPGKQIPSIRLFVQALSGTKSIPVDLGTDKNVYIPLVQWLPDAKHLAVERLSRDQKTLDLLLINAATGASQLILTEKDAYWINLANDLHFLKDSHRFIWSSERSGYRHFYLYDIGGHELGQLTHGDWEITSLAGVDEASSTAYFTATEASPLERQLYRVSLDASGFTRITTRKGTHDVQLAPSGDVLLDEFSDHATATRQDLLRTDGTTIAKVSENLPNVRGDIQLSSVEFLGIETHMNVELNAWIIKPPDFNPTRQYPVIFFVAGGPGEQAVRDAWGGDIFLWFALMAQKGYIVFALDNRGTAGRGHFFEEPIHLRFSSTEMADVRDGINYLRSLPWIDKSRIGICGFGYGGFLAVHGMLDHPLTFKAGFAGSPITDWHLYNAFFSERYLGDPQRNQDGWLASSPLENAKNLSAPLLIAQATLDETVHFENSLSLLDQLLDKGKYSDILLFPDRHTLFEDHGSRMILFQRLTDFFLQNL